MLLSFRFKMYNGISNNINFKLLNFYIKNDYQQNNLQIIKFTKLIKSLKDTNLIFISNTRLNNNFNNDILNSKLDKYRFTNRLSYNDNLLISKKEITYEIKNMLNIHKILKYNKYNFYYHKFKYINFKNKIIKLKIKFIK